MLKESHLEIMRHSAAHLLASAVLKLYPSAKLGIGPAIKTGFYYDFDLPKPITQKDLPKIEETMRGLVEKAIKFEKKIISKKEAKKLFKNQPYKLELIDEIEGERVSVYKTGEFIDLCKGPHLKSTAEIGPFKLISIAGAYWRGSENNPQLLRIYGTCFENEKELKRYLDSLEKAKERDHRQLGVQLDLYSFHEEAPGMVFFHPKGKIVYEKLVELSRQISQKYGFKEIQAPNVLDVKLWKISGHFDHYKQAMYFVPPHFALRPMGCPGMILIYKTKTRSFRDLPIRFNEFDTIFRKELSGTLHGLFRLKQFVQDDAHIFLMPDQIEDEVKKIIKSIQEVYQIFNLGFEVHLSTRPADFMGEKKIWDKAERALKQALNGLGMDFQIDEGEGAFYGPKIDFHIKDSMDRTWQCGTIQLDFFMPQRFNLEYIDKDGKPKQPVMIHRVILGSIERFIGILIEHTGGALPFWLSPTQVVVLPIAERHKKYAKEVKERIYQSGYRTEIDERNETLDKKIRDWETQKVPYILVVGDKEVKNKTIALRAREKGDLGEMQLERFLKEIKS